MAVAAAIGAAGQLLGNLTNQMFAKRNARINYEYAEKSAQNQYNRQVDFWNMQNAYNDPSAARSRMEQAGMNPTTNMGSGVNAAGEASTVPGNEVAQKGMMPVVPTDWSGFTQQVAGIYQAAMQGGKLAKEAARLELLMKIDQLKASGMAIDNDVKAFERDIKFMFGEDNARQDNLYHRHVAKQAGHLASISENDELLSTNTLFDRMDKPGLENDLIRSSIGENEASAREKDAHAKYLQGEYEKLQKLLPKFLEERDAEISRLRAESGRLRAVAEGLGISNKLQQNALTTDNMNQAFADAWNFDPRVLPPDVYSDVMRQFKDWISGTLSTDSMFDTVRGILDRFTTEAGDMRRKGGHIPSSYSVSAGPLSVGYSH